MATTSQQLVPFDEATRITRLDTYTYRANFSSAWCIGSVPNGGYVASVMLRVASLHLSGRGQTDTMSAHFEYPNRTEVGPAILTVEEVKLGRTVSTLHITVHQNDLLPSAPWLGPGSRKNVLGYVMNSRIALEQGVSVDSGWRMTPPPKPADLALVGLDRDPHWSQKAKLRGRSASFQRAHNHLEWYVPREGTRRGTADIWLRFKDGHRFTNASLGYVVDAHSAMLEDWRPKRDEEQTPFRSDDMFWYPTLALNLEVKRALPEEGAEWLFIRCTTKVVRNGRLDLDVIVLDREENVVALSNHVSMVLSAERNLKARSHSTPRI
ncbi:hypothetical protein CTRI78_v002633 [Colletotrichum trifolii]|uniref:Thioesterase family protein n=1 Tax=Colletotrichum trifolii TaxID=5466 RepID=A0A4R8RX65_COLTR|nr:hypothetical protein CTRI78_v002633 [Colletotrichum trifolii]